MTASRSLRRYAAWVVPAATIATVTAIVVLPSTATAGAHPNLPAKTPGQLLAAVETTTVEQLSGTVVETARLGLPDLPGADDASALSLQTLATGTHTFRLWLDGPDRQRLAMLGQLSESDVVHNGADLWTFNSNTQTVGHTTISSHGKATEPSNLEKIVTKHTPQDVAAQALKAVDPSTRVTVDRTARVAGRAAYTLILTPRDSRSTVREVAIAIDAQHKVPLRVQVFGKASKPAFEIAFTDVSFNKPAASVFRFAPPKGAKVTKDLFGTAGSAAAPDTAAPAPQEKAGGSAEVLGSGWITVLSLPAGGSPRSVITDGSAGAKDRTTSLLDKLTTTLPNGDKFLRTALVNVLTTTDGRTFVGAVSADVLEQAATGKLG